MLSASEIQKEKLYATYDTFPTYINNVHLSRLDAAQKCQSETRRRSSIAIPRRFDGALRHTKLLGACERAGERHPTFQMGIVGEATTLRRFGVIRSFVCGRIVGGRIISGRIIGRRIISGRIISGGIVGCGIVSGRIVGGRIISGRIIGGALLNYQVPARNKTERNIHRR
jgi:hypothetical protein